MKASEQGAKGFKSLWIRFDVNSTERHQLFFKQHSLRNQQPEYPKNQTLFVLNVPPYATTDCLKHAFAQHCGDVRSVAFTNAKGFKTAYIVFESEFSLNKAMELSMDRVMTLNTDENACLTGLEKWSKEYNDTVCDERATKREIEEYMKSYDKDVNDRIAKTAEEDDDGWTTVTGRKKRGQFAPTRKESTMSKTLQKEEQRKRKKRLLNFYTFQIREAKKQNLAELREKFELDKKRLQELKLKRTFKPF
ncbi:PREDICTED: ribosomal RNA-processing protein 7 homolog A [Dinoponera quadriceps]|uniref:Ribosomal RNA-processing protein 7 homolog A n=1 Tax=Dinoponera quadriceps TaxID=609295 RepID=A0A6P3YGV3_DINQU|nr:PREDICTED: ribosomal RNA-processing protein 7 homolog A [Dinoponera quadriceps]